MTSSVHRIRRTSIRSVLAGAALVASLMSGSQAGAQSASQPGRNSGREQQVQVRRSQASTQVDSRSAAQRRASLLVQRLGLTGTQAARVRTLVVNGGRAPESAATARRIEQVLTARQRVRYRALRAEQAPVSRGSGATANQTRGNSRS